MILSNYYFFFVITRSANSHEKDNKEYLSLHVHLLNVELSQHMWLLLMAQVQPCSSEAQGDHHSRGCGSHAKDLALVGGNVGQNDILALICAKFVFGPNLSSESLVSLYKIHE